MEIVENFGGEARTIATHGAGRFLGELNMLTGQEVYLSAVVREAGEVLSISPENLKEVITEEPTLSDIILKAFLARRSLGGWRRLDGGATRSPVSGRGRHIKSGLGQLPTSGPGLLRLGRLHLIALLPGVESTL